MRKLAFLLFIGGIYLLCSGAYDLYVQSGTSRKPTTVTVAELEKSVPANRHLIVTGGRPVSAAAIKFYRTQWGSKVSGSEILFIPIADASSPAASLSKPSILLRVEEDDINAAKAGQKIDFKAIEGVRTTSMDLEDKAQQRLVENFGKDAVDRMVILCYHGSIGMGTGLGKLAGGVVLVGGLVAAFVFGRRSTVSTPPIASSAPPPVMPS